MQGRKQFLQLLPQRTSNPCPIVNAAGVYCQEGDYHFALHTKLSELSFQARPNAAMPSRPTRQRIHCTLAGPASKHGHLRRFACGSTIGLGAVVASIGLPEYQEY